MGSSGHAKSIASISSGPSQRAPIAASNARDVMNRSPIMAIFARPRSSALTFRPPGRSLAGRSDFASLARSAPLSKHGARTDSSGRPPGSRKTDYDSGRKILLVENQKRWYLGSVAERSPLLLEGQRPGKGPKKKIGRAHV